MMQRNEKINAINDNLDQFPYNTNFLIGNVKNKI